VKIIAKNNREFIYAPLLRRGKKAIGSGFLWFCLAWP